MVNIEIICIGKIKESFFKDAITEYSKRLSKYCHLTFSELPDEPIPKTTNTSIENDIKKIEGNSILKKLKKESFVITLDLKGKSYTSEDFSSHLEEIAVKGNSHITFIIGGSLRTLAGCFIKVR